MALINFPNAPSLGTIYTFGAGTNQEKSFKFLAGESGTASDGYWSAFAGNIFNPATAAEINAGVVPDKYIAPDQLGLSKYIDEDGGTMLGYLKGVNPQTAQDFATKVYTDGTKNLSGTGYMKFPGGLILQWGSRSSVNNEVVTLPIAYTVAHFITIVGQNEATTLGCGADTLILNSFRYKTSIGGGDSHYYVSLGY